MTGRLDKMRPMKIKCYKDVGSSGPMEISSSKVN